MNPRLAAIAQAVVVVIVSALLGVLAKFALRRVAPFSFAWLQVAIAGVVLSLYTFGICRERLPRRLSGRVWLLLTLIGLGNFAAVRVLFLNSLDRLPATTHAYLVNFVGFATMGLSVVMLRERPFLTQLAGAALALVGLRVFFWHAPAAEASLGLICAAAGVAILAVTNNLARKLAVEIVGGGGGDAAVRPELSNNLVSTIALWIGGAPIVAAGLLFDLPPRVTGWESWGIIGLSAVVGVAVGMTVWNHVLRTLRSYEASLLGSLAVVFTALFATPILGERLTPSQSVGVALLLAGVALVQIRRGSMLTLAVWLGARRAGADSSPDPGHISSRRSSP